MSFVLQRIGPVPVYATEPGSPQPYTRSLRLARKFTTTPDAKASMCPDTEIVRPI